MGRIEMQAFLIFIVIASCNAELYQTKTTYLPPTADTRIQDGSPTTIEQYPFIIQVLFNNYFQCGGSLVTTRHVLSAAHCFIIRRSSPEIDPSKFFIRAGTTIMNEGGSLHSVTAITNHELYDLVTMKNDVAVVLMTTPVDLTTSLARLALLPYQDAVVPDNSFVISIGWGQTEVGPSSTVLMEVTLRKVNLNTCQARYNKPQNQTHRPHRPGRPGRVSPIIISSMICAGNPDTNPGQGPCKGDSGGPLLYKGIVVGIASLSTRCQLRNLLGVYTRVANFTNWIKYTVNDSQLQIQAQNGIGNDSVGKVGAITLLTSLLYLILSV